MTQQCGRCKLELPIESFSPSYRGKRGSWCRPCFAAYSRGDRTTAKPHAPQVCSWCEQSYIPKQIKAKARSEGRGGFCSKQCGQESRNAAMRGNRDLQLRKKYGMPESEYHARLAAQGGRCAICRAEQAGGIGLFHVDHCHASGVVRGLLCMRCNHGLGNFKDDPALLRRAAEYLEAGASA